MMLSEEGKKVKSELERLSQAKRRLRNLQEELQNWEELSGVLKSSTIGEVVGGGAREPYAEKRIIKIEQLTEAIEKAIDEAIALENTFLKHLSLLDPLSQNLLMERYMSGKSIGRIMRDFKYSRAQVFRLYDNLFEEVAENSKNETK